MSKFPFYKQLDGMDCGPSCLRMIAKYYGKTFSVQQLREQSYIQRTGVNLLGISEAAASIGLRATGIRTSMEKLKQQSKLPCIIHWNQEHFVVLYKIEKKRGKTWFYIADPAYGLLKYEEQELKKCWISTTQGGIEKGIALLLDVTPQFYEAEPIKYEKTVLVVSVSLCTSLQKGDDAAHHRPAGRQFAATGLPFSHPNYCRPRHRAQESEFYTAHFGRTTHAGIQPHTY